MSLLNLMYGKDKIVQSKRYLFLAIIYIILIYATSGIMRVILNWIKSMPEFLMAFILFSLTSILLFIGPYLVCRKIKYVQTYHWIIAGFIVFTYGVCFKLLSIPEEKIHLAEYGFLSGLFTLYYIKSNKNPIPHVLIIILVSLVGIGDEFVQWLRPNRVGDIRDVLINVIAAVLAQGLLFLYIDLNRIKDGSLKTKLV